MRMYSIRVLIQSIDHAGTAQASEVVLGKVPADSIDSLVAYASTLGESFVQAVAPPPPPAPPRVVPPAPPAPAPAPKPAVKPE